MIAWTEFAEISDKWLEYDVVGKLENNLQLVRIVSDISARIMLKKSSFLFVCKIIIMCWKNDSVSEKLYTIFQWQFYKIFTCLGSGSKRRSVYN